LVSAITKAITTVLGIILIIIGLIGIPLPIFPGTIFVILGASLLGYPVASTIRKYIKKAKKMGNTYSKIRFFRKPKAYM